MGWGIGVADSGLTDAEREVLQHLSDAYDAFIRLPVQHPMHTQEFVGSIHAAQRLVMSRPVARAEGWVIPVWTAVYERKDGADQE